MEHKQGVFAIMDGIRRKLGETFPGVKIYGDSEIEQGLVPPVFFLSVLSPTRAPGLGPRYRARYPFTVCYSPAAEGANAELLDVGERLMEALEYITVEGNLVRGVSLSYELADGVLHFFVSYNLMGRKAVPETLEMEEAAMKTEIKE